MSIQLVRFGLDNKKLIKKFVQFEWQHYNLLERFIPRLKAELLGSRLMGIKGLLTPEHPYHRDADVSHWLAYRKGRIVGRISAAVNHAYNRFHGVNTGNFGFFECIEDYEVAEKLFDAAADWLRRQGVEFMRGPGNYSNATHEVQGWVIQNFHDYPTIDLTWNKWYYPAFAEKYGFKKTKDYYAYINSVHSVNRYQNDRLMQRIADRTKLTIRKFDMKNIRSEVNKVVEIYNKAWENNWGYMPISNDEAQIMAETLKLVADPNLILFAMDGDREIAVVGMLPDLNEAFRRRRSLFGNSDMIRLARFFLTRKKIERARIMFFGIYPEYRKSGIDALTLFRARHYLLNNTEIRRAEASLILEENMVLRNTFTAFGGYLYKTYRLYDYDLSGKGRICEK